MGATLRRFTPDDIHLEQSSLVWLDSSVNILQESKDAQQRLRSLTDNLTTFDCIDLCEQYIESLPDRDRVIFIVSGQLGEQIVPRIHQRRQIVSIYVYCGNKQKQEKWVHEFPKIRGVSVQLDELISQIRSDQAKQQHSGITESLTFTTFDPKQQLTVELNGQFVHSQLLSDCLLQLISTSADRDELISLCIQEYQSDEGQLALIQEFEDTYSCHQAIYWYTRDAFVYRMLNKALRAQNIHLLFLFRFLIRDLEKQLKDNQCSSPLTTFRGQIMQNEEFEILKHSIGKLISINSFLSTSLDRPSGYKFLLKPTDHERVLFEIHADPRLSDIKSFANITSLSYYRKEAEVLFMLGSIFRVGDMSCDRNSVWTVKLTLGSDHGLNFKSVLNQMKSENRQSELGLVRLGDVLQQMGKYDDAERYYHRCLNALPCDDEQNISICYYALGRLAYSRGDYDASLKWFNKSLEIDMKNLKPNDPNIANTHNGIANIYQAKCDFKRALESYNKALGIFRQAFGEIHLHVALCLNNIGVIYQQEHKYLEALKYYQDALTIRKENLPDHHCDLGASYNNIGIVCRHLGQSDQALEQYNLALNIYKISLPPQHPDIAMTLENIGIVHEEKGDWKQALLHYKEADVIYHQVLPSTHPYVVQIKQSVQRMSLKLK